MEEAVTFNGQQASHISFKAIKEAMDSVDSIGEPKIHHLLHRCTEQQWESITGKQEKVDTDSEYSKSVLYGWPVYERSYVPLGEVWLMDKDGKVIEKFSFNQ